MAHNTVSNSCPCIIQTFLTLTRSCSFPRDSYSNKSCKTKLIILALKHHYFFLTKPNTFSPLGIPLLFSCFLTSIFIQWRLTPVFPTFVSLPPAPFFCLITIFHFSLSELPNHATYLQMLTSKSAHQYYLHIGPECLYMLLPISHHPNFECYSFDKSQHCQQSSACLVFVSVQLESVKIDNIFLISQRFRKKLLRKQGGGCGGLRFMGYEACVAVGCSQSLGYPGSTHGYPTSYVFARYHDKLV